MILLKIISLPFYCMADAIKFWTKDRYFSDINEKRIGRVSFFLRMLSIFVMVALLWIAISMGLINLIGLGAMFAWPTVLIWLSVILLFSVPTLVRKRSHDFDSNGKIASYIILWSLGLNLILNINTLFVLYTGSFASIMTPNILIQILSYTSMWLAIASIIVFIILIFRPATVGTNSYWELLK